MDFSVFMDQWKDTDLKDAHFCKLLLFSPKMSCDCCIFLLFFLKIVVFSPKCLATAAYFRHFLDSTAARQSCCGQLKENVPFTQMYLTNQISLADFNIPFCFN